MSEMSAAIERLRFAVRTLPGVLAGFSEAESEQRPSPERWTKKEILGHLIDSASNNHQRFVRGQLNSGQDFPGYEQEQWVRIQGYQAARWSDLIDLWRAYNTHLLHVIGCMTEESRRATCRVGGGAEVDGHRYPGAAVERGRLMAKLPMPPLNAKGDPLLEPSTTNCTFPVPAPLTPLERSRLGLRPSATEGCL